MHSEKQVRFKTNLQATKHPTKSDFCRGRREKSFITFVACVSIFCNLVISIIFWLNMAAFLCALSSDICFENWQTNQDKSVCFNNSDHHTPKKIRVDNAMSQSELKERKEARENGSYISACVHDWLTERSVCSDWLVQVLSFLGSQRKHCIPKLIENYSRVLLSTI